MVEKHPNSTYSDTSVINAQRYLETALKGFP
jgi:hypothetical protein